MTKSCGYKPPRTARSAIRDFCYQCMGWEPGSRQGRRLDDVRGCTATGCPLYVLRERFFKVEDGRDREEGPRA